jgi:hypothetical protein
LNREEATFMRRFCYIALSLAICSFLLNTENASATSNTELHDEFVPIKFVGAWTPFFEANDGQYPADVKFISRGMDYALHLKSNGMDLQLANLYAPTNQIQASSIKIRFVGAHPYPTTEGLGKSSTPMKYYLETNPRQVRSTMGYSDVHYKSIFPGIDLFFSCKSTYLEYYFVLSKHANLYNIVMEYSGAQKLSLNEDGELIIHTKAGDIIRPAPKLYQEINGVREQIPGGYVLLTKNRVGFDAGPYNQMASLIIDPVLVFFRAEDNWDKSKEENDHRIITPSHE